MKSRKWFLYQLGFKPNEKVKYSRFKRGNSVIRITFINQGSYVDRIYLDEANAEKVMRRNVYNINTSIEGELIVLGLYKGHLGLMENLD